MLLLAEVVGASGEGSVICRGERGGEERGREMRMERRRERDGEEGRKKEGSEKEMVFLLIVIDGMAPFFFFYVSSITYKAHLLYWWIDLFAR